MRLGWNPVLAELAASDLEGRRYDWENNMQRKTAVSNYQNDQLKSKEKKVFLTVWRL